MGELLGADTDLLDRVAESLSTGAEQLQDVRGAAQRAVTELQASWRGPDLLQLTQQWGQQVSLLLAEVSASLGVCAAQLRAQSAAQRTASRTDTGSFTAKPVPMPLILTPPGSPPATGQPAKAATWWRSLSPEQQHQVITNHPDWIGNRDGIPFTARDLANRALVSVARDRLSAQTEQMLTDGERLKRAMTSSPSKGVLTAGSVALGNGALGNAALGNVEAKLASLQAIDATLAQPGDRQLLLLDLSKERAQAAIARGNVDTADNVTVVVPGLSTNVNSMLTNDRTMGDLQRHTELESGRAHTGQGTATTATVMWVGYQAPQL
ncbi:MAG: hypothetical protein QOE58_552, partial [Actinomycetota bacterium]|nr:hypothetical protein [Actinomycetota bacterium]